MFLSPVTKLTEEVARHPEAYWRLDPTQKNIVDAEMKHELSLLLKDVKAITNALSMYAWWLADILDIVQARGEPK